MHSILISNISLTFNVCLLYLHHFLLVVMSLFWMFFLLFEHSLWIGLSFLLVSFFLQCNQKGMDKGYIKKFSPSWWCHIRFQFTNTTRKQVCCMGINSRNSLAQVNCDVNIFVANPCSQIKNTHNSLANLQGKTFPRKFATEDGSLQICDGKEFVANCDGKWFLANLQ